jgi:hypothetical protein
MKMFLAMIALTTAVACGKKVEAVPAPVVAEPAKVEAVPTPVNPQITDAVTQSVSKVEASDAGVIVPAPAASPVK